MLCFLRKMQIRVYAILCCLVFMTSELAALNSIERFSNQDGEINSPFAEYFVKKWITSIARVSTKNLTNDTYSTTEQKNNMSRIINDINSSLGGNILIKNGEMIRIDYGNLLDSIKYRGRQILDALLGKEDFMLTLISQQALNNYLDKYFSQFEDIIKVTNFSTNIQTRYLRASATTSSLTDITRKFLEDVLIQLCQPLQVQLNDLIMNAMNSLMAFYQPSEPSGFFQTISTSIINRMILLVVDFLDSQRTIINDIFVTSDQTETQSLLPSGQSDTSESRSTKSIIDDVLAPVRFLVAVIFTPLHAIFTFVTNIVFNILRPIFGGEILGNIEGIVRRIIRFIPCIRC